MKESNHEIHIDLGMVEISRLRSMKRRGFEEITTEIN
jgi:hypothetical protein